MRRSGLIGASCGAAAGLLVCGCSGNSPLPSLPDIAEALNPWPVVGPPTDIYARVARGALSCWFGTAGPLKAGYVYHAEADPPAKGGKAEIIIHQRNPSADNYRGMRAFRIQIAPDDDSSVLTIENLNLPEPLAKAMEQDVHRWAAGVVGCAEAKRGWEPRPPEPREDPNTWKTRAKKKGRST